MQRELAGAFKADQTVLLQVLLQALLQALLQVLLQALLQVLLQVLLQALLQALVQALVQVLLQTLVQALLQVLLQVLLQTLLQALQRANDFAVLPDGRPSNNISNQPVASAPLRDQRSPGGDHRAFGGRWHDAQLQQGGFKRS
ncbi:hypothetical protein EYF80_053725 [Liparis tanakae]|uniref:Uncharacterized protein n=1 Tax=Liparis tanakae TaxID=230148 RepID=A0A4Z2F4S1_9TELE|nr:hypothetical protein EYF80_053725 [Liparis tanakae]